MKKLTFCFVLVLNGSFGGIASAGAIEHLSYADFLTTSGAGTIHEDWASIPNSTIIQDQTIGGITYRHQDYWGRVLQIGHGSGWGARLGTTFPSSGGDYSLSWDNQVTFEFGAPIHAFGINFSQWSAYSAGTSVFAVQVDGGEIFYRSIPVTQYGTNAGYLGLSGLDSAMSVKIWRSQSGTNYGWSVFSLDYANVPAPAAFAILSCAGLVGSRRRR